MRKLDLTIRGASHIVLPFSHIRNSLFSVMMEVLYNLEGFISGKPKALPCFKTGLKTGFTLFTSFTSPFRFGFEKKK